jgi:hypothetical protein
VERLERLAQEAVAVMVLVVETALLAVMFLQLCKLAMAVAVGLVAVHLLDLLAEVAQGWLV